jgi:hypothetical protein
MFRKVMVVNGDTLIIPGLKRFKGKKVEITLNELSEKKESSENLKKYFGILKTSVDALEFQKKLRAEWDEREKYF